MTRGCSTAAALLAASLLLGGCAAGPAAPDKAIGTAPVAEVGSETGSWDPGEHPERVARDDYISIISSEYDVWAPGASWRISGDGWEAGEKVTVSVLPAAQGNVEETTAGDPVELQADDFGQFASAYPVPKDTAAGDYELRAASAAGRLESTSLTIVKDK